MGQTFDSAVLMAQKELLATINKYQLPASVVILICDNMRLMAGQQLNLKGAENDDSKETNDSNNAES